jgi:Uncharacterised protein family (UPF0014)
MLSVAGLISIPGMMTGQILAGGDAVVAAKYQVCSFLSVSLSPQRREMHRATQDQVQRRHSTVSQSKREEKQEEGQGAKVCAGLQLVDTDLLSLTDAC